MGSPRIMPASNAAVSLSLFRSLLRQAKKVDNYNFRHYAIRRVKTGFQMNRDLTGDDIGTTLRKGQEQLDVLRRQVVLGGLYPSAKSVMEGPIDMIYKYNG